jgi:hypothetical protein
MTNSQSPVPNDARQRAADSLKAYFEATQHPSLGSSNPRDALDAPRAAEIRAVLSDYEPMSLSLARRLYEMAPKPNGCPFCKREAAAALDRLPAIQCPKCHTVVV